MSESLLPASHVGFKQVGRLLRDELIPVILKQPRPAQTTWNYEGDRSAGLS